MDKAFRDALAKELGIPPEEQAMLDAASNHKYSCRCEQCRQWWKSVGPDPDSGKYGPFTEEEVKR